MPAHDQAVRFGLDVVNQDERSFYVSGWAHAGGTSRDQRVEIVLHRPDRTLVFPAVSVARGDLDEQDPATSARARTGFRALVSKQALPPGRYRLGVLVRRAGREHLSYALRPVDVRPAGVP